MRRPVGPEDPYHLHLSFTTILNSFACYTSLIFGAEGAPWASHTGNIDLLLAAMLGYGIILRRKPIVFGISAYILTLLPVTLLPRISAGYYVYAPQLFLIFAICLLIQDLICAFTKSGGSRWAGSASATLVLLFWDAHFETSAYFISRANFILDARIKVARSTRDALRQFGHLRAGSHIYVSHGDERPWLFEPGPCAFLQVVNHQRSIACVFHKPEILLRNLYLQDTGPKAMVIYHADGSLSF